MNINPFENIIKFSEAGVGFTKSEILDSLDTTIEDFNVAFKPTLEQLKEAKVFSSPKSSEAKTLFKQYRKINRKDELVEALDKVSKHGLAHLNYLRAEVERNFPKALGEQPRTLKEITTLRLVEITGWSITYFLKYVEWLLALELKQTKAFDSFPPRAIIKELDANYTYWCVWIEVFGITPQEFKTKYEKIPNTVVTEDSLEITRKVSGDSAINGFSLGIFPTRLNPFYFVRRLWTRIRLNMYYENVERRKVIVHQLELLVSKLDKERQRSVDTWDTDSAEITKLEKAIRYRQSQSDKLSKQIDSFRNDYGIEGV